ncbi:hypothetical protein HGA91_03145 [candidate division WWE3 bacterium]|nr:hypothetical protein [candidate division WWE3 bacterium]
MYRLKAIISSTILRSILITILIAGLSFGVIYYVGTQIKSISQTTIVGIPQYPTRINPLWGNANSIDETLSKVIYPGLITFDRENKPVGDLADHWEISEDKKTYTVYLKPDLTWDDGHTITAEDVVFTYSITQSNEYTGREKKRFQDVQMEIVNESTVKFTLIESFAPFLESLDLGVLPKHVWGRYPISEMKNIEFNLKPVGSGSYHINDIKIENSRILQMDIEPRHKTTDRLSRITFKFYTNESEVSSAFKLGEIDTFLTYDRDLFNQFNAWENAQISQTLVCGQSLSIFFNDTRPKNHPIVASDFKDAMMATLNRPDIGITAKNFPTAQFHWAYEAKNEIPDLSKDKITEVFKQHNLDNPFVMITPDTELTKTRGYELVTLLQGQGLNVQLQVVSAEELQSNILPERKFDFLLVFQQFGHDPDQYAFWHSSQTDISKGGLNVSGYATRAMDQILEDGRNKTDQAERTDVYHKFQQMLIESRPALFLDYPILYEISRKNSPQLLTNPCIWHETDYLIDAIK